MSYGLKDFFVGVIYLFVIFLPGALLLGFVLVTVAPLAAPVARQPMPEAGRWIAFLGASYLVGHLVSLVGAAIEDRLLPEKWAKWWDDRADVSPELRRAAAAAVAARLPEGVVRKNWRRWAAVILREDGSPSHGDLERKDADRRFFRNVSFVLLVGGVLLLLVGCGDPFVDAAALPRAPALAVGAWLLAVLSFVRYGSQDGSYTRMVFEALVVAQPELAGRSAESPTLELRWFFAGESPAELERSFDGPCGRTFARTDEYLRGTGEALGVKLRDGALELKVRTASWEEKGGIVECWTKRRLEAGVPWPAAGAWLTVAKKRRLRKFALVAGQLTEVDAESPAETGCQAELTTLDVDGRVAWTLGFEAFGPPFERRRAFDDCVATVLDELQGFDPALADCRAGYPAWIARQP